MDSLEDTIAVRAGESFDTEKVEQYLRDRIEDIGEGILQVRQFPSGASNLTYLLRIGDWEGVLRRPPLGPVPPKAHDMKRESSLLQHINPVFPLAPKPYFYCNDTAILGAPFYVMERRQGVVVDRSFPPGVTPTLELCEQMSHTVIDTLVQIHAIDWQAAGLDTFGHPPGFLERQVKGWLERYHRAKTDEIPHVESLTNWFLSHIPQSPPATLIHNDFKLNNMMLDEHDLTRAVAVFDWEMATIGDPLFDLACTLTYWATADDPDEWKTGAVTWLPGFVSRDTFMEIYAQKSSRDLSSMNFYMTFAYFKNAVIGQQIYVRWKRGQTQDERFAALGDLVQMLIEYAAHMAGV